MWVLGGGKLEREAKDFYRRIVLDTDNDLGKLFHSTIHLKNLQEQISKLEIEKSQIEEKHQKREREIEHKLGLEKQRQEQDLDIAKRKATIDAEEKFLVQKKDLFTTEMNFTRDRMTTEVEYLKGMVGQVLERLPDARVIASFGDKEKTKKSRS